MAKTLKKRRGTGRGDRLQLRDKLAMKKKEIEILFFQDKTPH